MKGLLDDRKQKILEFISGNESISVKELSRLVHVSEATIRTDLDVLEKNGKIIRFHGGARLIENRYKQEFDYQIRKNLNFQHKKKIGEIAAEMVDSNESIVLDASTTSFAMAQALRRRDDLKYVTIIPFGIWTAVELMGYKNFNILLPGGYLRHGSASISGLPALNFFEGLIIQKAFMGAWGISFDQGLTDRHLQEVELKKRIISRAKETIITVDGSKFNQSGIASYASIGQVSKIITDNTAPTEEIEKIRQLGMEVFMTD
ncbi:MAG: DeoR/GlpR transcriptional regulator [Bacteroidetes bacterium]|nr:DeoR/GlpR transcriptional regulator [Bacteroidota bacterium]